MRWVITGLICLSVLGCGSGGGVSGAQTPLTVGQKTELVALRQSIDRATMAPQKIAEEFRTGPQSGNTPTDPALAAMVAAIRAGHCRTGDTVSNSRQLRDHLGGTGCPIEYLSDETKDPANGASSGLGSLSVQDPSYAALNDVDGAQFTFMGTRKEPALNSLEMESSVHSQKLGTIKMTMTFGSTTDTAAGKHQYEFTLKYALPQYRAEFREVILSPLDTKQGQSTQFQYFINGARVSVEEYKASIGTPFFSGGGDLEGGDDIDRAISTYSDVYLARCGLKLNGAAETAAIDLIFSVLAKPKTGSSTLRYMTIDEKTIAVAGEVADLWKQDRCFAEYARTFRDLVTQLRERGLPAPAKGTRLHLSSIYNDRTAAGNAADSSWNAQFYVRLMIDGEKPGDSTAFYGKTPGTIIGLDGVTCTISPRVLEAQLRSAYGEYCDHKLKASGR